MSLNAKNNAGLSVSRLIGMCFMNVYAIKLAAKYGFTSFDQVRIVQGVNLILKNFNFDLINYYLI